MYKRYTAPAPSTGRGARTGAIRLGVTLGDPRGIGPEVSAKALVAVGRRGGRAARFGGAGRAAISLDAVRVVGPAELGRDFEPLCRFEVVGGARGGLAPGAAAGLAVERAVELAMAGRLDAVVTAPVHKPSLAAAGRPAGHTEFLAALAGVDTVGMLMCDEGAGGDSAPKPRRVLPATTHLPLAEVPARVTEGLLVSQTRLLGEALASDWGIPEPRVALCALNPHASDEGIFGSEEREVYEPALRALARDPWRVAGPLPADTVFRRAFAGEFDAVVAPYHDVAMAAFKTVAFGRGVNVTLGLPFVRTSPDHGTAFDIAGRGVADASSMVAAIELATELASRRMLGTPPPTASRPVAAG